MTLCGARSGVRFESDLLGRLTSISSSIQSVYKELSDTFSAIPSEEKKLIYSSSNAFLEGSRAKLFVDKANELSFIITELRSIVKLKRSTIVQGQQISAVKDPDGLPAGTGASRPAWLETLVKKYTDFVAAKQAQPPPPPSSSSAASASASSSSAAAATTTTATTLAEVCGGDGSYGTTSSSTSSYKITKGKFACFLSLCVYGAISCIETQKDAIILLLEASNDSIVQIYHHFPLESVVSKILSQPKEYWGRRIYYFICSLSEVKAMPADADSVTNYTLYLY